MYPVIWRNLALDELADAIVAADLPTQDRIEKAVLALNARLARDPHNFGESRPARYRIAFHAPVGILFDIDPPTQAVRVAHCWTYF